MTDIIELLRTRNHSRTGHGLGPVCDAAADEIERLRADLLRIIDTYDAYRRRGVSPAPAEYADVVAAIDAARGKT